MAKILLIDDDTLVAETISHTLSKAGHDVTVAANGAIGISTAAAVAPDVVITDMFMPESDGMDVVRSLRGQSDKLPIIVISGGGRMGNFHFLEIAKKLGASAYLTKPFNNQRLIATIANCLMAPETRCIQAA